MACRRVWSSSPAAASAVCARWSMRLMSSVCWRSVLVVSSSCCRKFATSPLCLYFRSCSSACKRLICCRRPAASFPRSVDSSCADSHVVFSCAFSRRSFLTSSSSILSCSRPIALCICSAIESPSSRLDWAPCCAWFHCFRSCSKISRWQSLVFRPGCSESPGSVLLLSGLPSSMGLSADCIADATPKPPNVVCSAPAKGEEPKASEPWPWAFSPIRARISDLSAPSASPESCALAPGAAWRLSVLSASSTRSCSSFFSKSAFSRAPCKPSFTPCNRAISPSSSSTFWLASSLAPVAGASAAATSLAFRRSNRRLFSSRSSSSALETTGSGEGATATLCVSSRALRMACRACSFSWASRRAFASACCRSSSSLCFRILSAATLLLSFPMRALHLQPRAKRCTLTAARRCRARALRAERQRRAAWMATVASRRRLASWYAVTARSVRKAACVASAKPRTER
mmetsp:Transcript_21238/g.60087  ORF Transcript_21238/g.60087 Transcript_21238/m.60087 type:complete len:460 (+) Transcript_21238:768-2147(+)